MAVFIDVAALIPTLGDRLDAGAQLAQATALMIEMADADIVAILRESAELSRSADQIRVVAAGIVAERSSRESGHSGLAQSHGHRTPASFVQELTGATKSEAARDTRVGQSMIERPSGSTDAEMDAEEQAVPKTAVWYEPLRAALSDGTLTAAQYDAIRRGLGEPPLPDDPPASEEELAALVHAIHEAWSLACERLVEEAAARTVEELGSAARSIRDLLDPEGAEARFLARHENRAFRTWRDADGILRGSLAFDDEGGAFLTSLLDSALRPRRGGPRFVDPEEDQRSEALIADPRTNEQLAYDLLLDVLRSGVLADVESVFGTRQAGVRLTQTVDAAGRRAPIALSEDGLVSMPASAADQRACESGYVPVTVNACGNPLDVGRERRLFAPRQRIALAVRDGGCRWRGCDRPASYCEAHHIDEWSGGGRTDIDRGILLCRFHHMNLHHRGWRITRSGTGDFVLHDPGGGGQVLRPRTVLTYLWAGVDPPPKRFRPAA